jgi:hypothetical protein
MGYAKVENGKIVYVETEDEKTTTGHFDRNWLSDQLVQLYEPYQLGQLNEPYRPAQYGWICPRCGRALSPHTNVCPCSNGKGWEITC